MSGRHQVIRLIDSDRPSSYELAGALLSTCWLLLPAIGQHKRKERGGGGGDDECQGERRTKKCRRAIDEIGFVTSHFVL